MLALLVFQIPVKKSNFKKYFIYISFFHNWAIQLCGLDRGPQALHVWEENEHFLELLH